MRRILFLVLVMSLSAPVFQGLPATAADKQPRKIVSGWIPYYAMKNVMPFIKKLPTTSTPTLGSRVTCEDDEYSAEDISLLDHSYLFMNKDLMKEVMPFWYSLKSPTVIRDDYTTANPSWPIADTLCLMRKTGLKLIPTITDGTDKLVLSGYLANTQSRTVIVKSIVDLVKKNSFDGIDLDFEGFAFVDGNATWAKTSPGWIAFIKELSTALHVEQKILSVTSPYAYDPTEKVKGYTVYSWSAIAQYIDRLRIMTYDYSIAKPGPIGPISWVEKTTKYAISIMPASKVFIGLPGYGRDWITSVTGTCPVTAPPGLTAGAKAATFKTNYASAKAVIDNATPTFDSATSEVTYSYVQNFNGVTAKGAATSCTVGRTVWYQNDRSYSERMNLVAKYDLGGSALWTLGMEDPIATAAMRNVAVSIGPDTVVNSISIDDALNKSIFYGGVFTIRGSLTLVDKTPIAGVPVNLEFKHEGEDSWKTIAQFTTSESGAFSTPVTIASTAVFRLSTSESASYAASLSSEEKITVLSKINLNRPNSVRHGQAIVITGVHLPQLPEQAVVLQKFELNKWQNVATATTGAAGEFQTSIVESKKGIVKLRVLITVKNQQTLSPEFSVVVR